MFSDPFDRAQVRSYRLPAGGGLLTPMREGVAPPLSIWPGMPHDFTLFAFLPEAQQGIAEPAQFFEQHPAAADKAKSSAVNAA